jgi:hypothetical protein
MEQRGSQQAICERKRNKLLNPPAAVFTPPTEKR